MHCDITPSLPYQLIELTWCTCRSASSWLKFVPWGLRELLKHIQHRYGGVPVYITENGMSDDGTLQDSDRQLYYKLYINQALKGNINTSTRLLKVTAILGRPAAAAIIRLRALGLWLVLFIVAKVKLSLFLVCSLYVLWELELGTRHYALFLNDAIWQLPLFMNGGHTTLHHFWVSEARVVQLTGWIQKKLGCFYGISTYQYRVQQSSLLHGVEIFFWLLCNNSYPKRMFFRFVKNEKKWCTLCVVTSVYLF